MPAPCWTELLFLFLAFLSVARTANPALGNTEFNFELNDQQFRFFPIVPVNAQVDVLILYTPEHQCKLTYYDWMKREWDWAVQLAPRQNLTIKTSHGHVFLIECGDGGSTYFQILPGKHHYNTTEIMQFPEQSGGVPPDPARETVRVVSTFDLDYCPKRFRLEPTWRDAIRTAAARHNVNLCFCGAGNVSTAHTVESPIPAYPFIVNGIENGCDCSHQNAYFYDFLMPCNHGESTPRDDTINLTNCAWQGLSDRIQQMRIHTINGLTSGWDRLMLKSTLWRSIKVYYGAERANMIMPTSYELKLCKALEEQKAVEEKNKDQQQSNNEANGEETASEDDSDEHIATKANLTMDELLDEYDRGVGNHLPHGGLCEKKRIEEKVKFEKENNLPPTLFITKNPMLSMQKGLSISHGEDILAGIASGHHFVTEYIPKPFLMNGYKLNLRRYMLVVCTGDRIRAWVHDDGKNFYGKLPFQEPQDESGNIPWRGNHEKMSEQLERLITTGYVPMTHYDDKPMTGTQFFDLMKARGYGDLGLLRKSMHTRLALLVHMSNQKFMAFETDDPNYFACRQLMPECVHPAIRSIHSGCDFQIDEELTGYRSRLFECNKGPDMHVHNRRDGELKLGVSADMVSFLGFKGDLNDTPTHARKYNLTKIYDTVDFSVDEAFAFLNGLKDLPPVTPQAHDEL